MLAVKEELTFGHTSAMLSLHKTVRRFHYKSSVVMMWELSYEWSSSASPKSSTATTQESGWVLIQPAVRAAKIAHTPVSEVRSFMQVALQPSSQDWFWLIMQKARAVPHAIGRAYEQIVLDRVQSVENCLVNDGFQIPKPELPPAQSRDRSPQQSQPWK